MSGYRTIFSAILVQDTALSSGGTGPGNMTVDSPFSKDGAGCLVLRGETLAGALIATGAKIFGHELMRQAEISIGIGKEKAKPSRWLVMSSSLPSDHRTEIRRSVGIRQGTGARADGVLFDLETTPRGTSWPILIEVRTHGETGAQAEKIAAAALKEWARGRCWIGAAVARGLGWCHLKDLKAIRLGYESVGIWPSNEMDPFETVKKAFSNETSEMSVDGEAALDPFWISEANFDQVFELDTVEGLWTYHELTCTITAGELESHGYGLDSIAVGGHEPAGLMEQTVGTNFLRPLTMREDAYLEGFEAHAGISMTHSQGGKPEPIVQGSSLRGPLRHALSRYYRAVVDAAIRDPNLRPPPELSLDEETLENEGETTELDDVELLFGNVDISASLLISDAHLVSENWTAALLHHHAEDEFAGGVFGTGKFTRTVLIDGQFEFRIVFEIPPNDLRKISKSQKFRSDRIDSPMNDLKTILEELGGNRALPIGGAKWRGAGWPEWAVETVRNGAAGSDSEVVQKECNK